jgi:hypothetical protein
LDALNDSIAARQVNKIEVPYRIIIRNFDLIGAGAKKMASDFVGLIQELAEKGTAVEITVQDSP